jgi:hypothetical protein
MKYITDYIVYDNKTPYYGNNLEQLLPEGVYEEALKTNTIESCYTIYKWENNQYNLFYIV